MLRWVLVDVPCCFRVSAAGWGSGIFRAKVRDFGFGPLSPASSIAFEARKRLDPINPQP